jgi:excisionase family DNA binding protein
MELLTEQQAAERLHLSRRKIQDLCRSGKIAFVQVTPRTRAFLPEHIDEFIRRRTVTPPKLVDRSLRQSLPSRRKGGELEKSFGDTAKALREEMRQWQ